jgi:hypothetical protein
MRTQCEWTSWRLSVAFLASVAVAITGCSSAAPEEDELPTGQISAAVTGTISWAGYQWTVRSGSGLGPGPNNWSADNVFVDANGYLHLEITNVSGTWYSAELYTTTNLGFGTYQWQIDAPLDTLDRNVVLGLFPYGPPTIGTDGTNEIDMEYSRWGSATNDNLWCTVYPSSGSTVGQAHYPFTLSGTYTTSRFTWSSTSVACWLMGGFQPTGTTTNVIDSWTYSSTTTNIPQSAMPLHINLWLFQGLAPSNGQPVEVVIKGFSKV